MPKQGASELGPCLCAGDVVYGEMLGWGLIRTQTFAERADKCDFRFKKGGPTRVTMPASLSKADERMLTGVETHVVKQVQMGGNDDR